MIRILFISLLLSLSLSYVQGASLGEYIEKTVSNHFYDKQLEAKLNELEQEKNSALLRENPELNLSYGRVKNTGITGSSVGVNLSQSFSISGEKDLMAQAIEERMKQEEFNLVVKKEELRKKMMAQYLKLWVLREKVGHTEHRIKDLEIIKKYLRNRAFSSPQQQSDAYLIKKKIEEIEYELQISRYEARKNEEVLKVLAGAQSIPFELEFKNKQSLINTFEDYVGDEENIHQKRKSQGKLADLTINQYERGWIPDLTLSYGYEKENVPGGNLGHAAGIGFSVPIFDWGQERASAEKARKISRSYEWKKKDLERSALQKQVKESFLFNLNYVKQGSLMSQEEKHKEELEKLKGFFMKGLINAQSFLDAEEMNHDLHFRFLLARVNLLTSYYDLCSLNKCHVELERILK